MSILDLHADELASVADNTPRTNEQPALWRPGFSFSGIARGARAAPFALAAEGLAVGAEALGVARQGIQYLTDPEQREKGPLKLEWSNDLADALRDRGREFRPDPETTHAAEQITFEAVRGIGKLAGYGLTMGPAGFVVAGVDEAMTQADDLKQRGVDLDTRAKAGAVAGLGLGAAGALPMAGATWKATAALYALGGPGAFIAQTAATRAILDDAGYPQIAAQHDPFDPLGLAIASIIPAPFAVLGMRAAARRYPVLTDEVSPADAARVLQLAQRERSTSLAKPGDLAAAAKDAQALDAAARQLSDGEPVRVADVAPELTPYARARIAEQLRALDELPPDAFPARLPPLDPLDDGVHRARPLDDPRLADEGVRAQLQAMAREAGWGQRGGELIRSGDDTPGDGGMGGEVVGRTSWIARAEWYAAMQREPTTRLPADQRGVEAAVRKALAGEPLTPQERRAVRYMLEIARDDADPLSGVNMARELEAAKLDDTADNRTDVALVARAAEIDEAAVERMAVQFEDDDAGFMRAVERFLDEHDAREAGRSDGDQPTARADASRPGGEGGDRTSVEGDREVGNPEGEAAEAAAVGERLETIARNFPELEIMADGMERPVSLREFLAAAQREADEAIADAPLLEVAAQCALTSGV